MAELLEAWRRLGLSAEAFWAATPRVYALEAEAAAEAARRLEGRATATAWMTAVLSRAKKIPSLKSLLPAEKYVDDDPEMKAAEQAAELAAMRIVMAERGQGRTWNEWLQSYRN